MLGFLITLSMSCAVLNLMLSQGCFNENFFAGVASILLGCLMSYLWGADS